MPALNNYIPQDEKNCYMTPKTAAFNINRFFWCENVVVVRLLP